MGEFTGCQIRHVIYEPDSRLGPEVNIVRDAAHVNKGAPPTDTAFRGMEMTRACELFPLSMSDSSTESSTRFCHSDYRQYGLTVRVATSPTGLHS